MQPPPVRKGPYLKTLKHVHTEQVARLQAKNQHECDLLEDIRNFTKQRSVIEKTYAEALLKISSAYLNKKIPSIPDLRDEDEDERWNVWNVWRTVLEENEKLARARLAAVEVFQQQITDDAKTIRQAKLQASKKCLDQLKVVQTEVQTTVSELDRQKKFYFEEEHLAHDARDKARDVEEKLKKKKGSIFSSFTSLQRSSVKFSNKKDACEEKSTGARNEYIIALAIANAHQDRYFNVDLDTCIRTLEGDVYDKLKEYLTVIGRTELLTCSAAQNSFSKIRDQAQMLSRDYNVMCCVQYYPVLKQHIRYPFEACDGDTCHRVTCDHGAGAALSMEAKKWAQKIGKEIRVIRENQKRLFQLQQLKEAGHKSDPDDPNGPDLDTKIDEVKENIRKAETEKCKAEAVIETLRDGNVNVDEWMSDIEALTATLDIPRSGSANSIKTDKSGGFSQEPQQHQSQQQQKHDSYYDSESNDASLDNARENESAPHESISTSIDHEEDIDAHVEAERKRIESLAATWDDPTQVDWGDAGEPEPPVTSPPVTATATHRDSWPTNEPEPGVVKCVALYSYTAQNPDELTIVENEHLELIGEGDGDGWVRARNYKGEEGYVPQNYVEVEGATSAAGYPLQPQISFSSVDYHVQDTSAGAGGMGADEVPDVDSSSVPISNGYPEPEVDYYQQQVQPASWPQDVAAPPEETPAPVTSVSSGGTTPFINELQGEEPEGMFCRALYDYEATAPEELSFYEGQIIRITNTMPHREDDGWWEGEYDGQKGLFPSVIVEECRWDGEPLYPEDEDAEDEEDEPSDSGIAPPAYTPPEVPGHLLPPETVVTQPTPEVEHPPSQKPPTNASSYDNNSNFEMELNSDQQHKYQTQFTEGEAEQQAPAVVIVTDAPDVTVTISQPENEIGEDVEKSDDGSSGLGVAQIVITAATPMSEEAKEFPQSADQQEQSTEESNNMEEEVPEPALPPPPPPPPLDEAEGDGSTQDIEPFADFSNQNFEADFSQHEAFGSEGGGGQDGSEETTRRGGSEIPSASSQDSENSSDTVQEVPHAASSSQPAPPTDLPPPPPPPPSEATTTKKTSLDIEDNDSRQRMSLGDSHESPVTPEELDVQNLAKLESLKESDA